MAQTNSNGKNLNQSSKAELLEVLNAFGLDNANLQERLLEMEMALEDEGWRRLSYEGSRDLLSPDGIIRVIEIARAAYLMNPLINHAVNVQANYVFGQGVSIRAKPDGDVNDIVQAWWDDPANKPIITDQLALWDREVQLRTEANIFFVFFPNILTGQTIVRLIDPVEIIRGGIIHNPEDREEPWFYCRTWNRIEFNPSNGTYTAIPAEQKDYYPDYRYNPLNKVPAINGHPVHWESPIMHIKRGGLTGQPFGIPEVYNALAWARAVKLDLEDYATIRRALARFAWNLKVQGGKKGVEQAKLKLKSAVNTSTGKDSTPPPAPGSTFIGAEGRDMQPMRTAGATMDPEEGRRLWLMVAAGTGIPETILAGNADVGNLATAATLDRPTELQMRNRQTFWEGVLREMGMYVLRQSALAPLGSVIADNPNDASMSLEVQVRVNATTPSGRLSRAQPRFESQKVEVDVTFPPILERSRKDNVAAVVHAATLGGRPNPGVFPPEGLRRRILDALGESDIDGALLQLEREFEDMGVNDPLENFGTGEVTEPEEPPGRNQTPGGGSEPTNDTPPEE